MSNGMLYLVRRDGTGIQFLCGVKVREFTRGADPQTFGLPMDVAKRASDAVAANRMDWEPYAEPGTPETIVENWKRRGKNFATSKARLKSALDRPAGSRQTKSHSLRRFF